MAKKYENDFKVMIVELLKSGRSTKEISEEYDLNDSMINILTGITLRDYIHL